ncbi:YbaB/EbfC family nucleoid-associated protein [Lentzea sp. NPDC060358]|uniref:YbaB/EbfC family nucleoid-associated protein n=1 Tax=Lentzea sp. NPDC060358 TaxID=3347103 RepID=UPI0036637BE0
MDDDAERAARKVREVERAVAEHAARSGPITARVSSPDGAVTVVATPGGPPREITVSPASLRMGPHGLAAEIVRIAEKARRAADAQLHRTLERVVDPRELTAMGIENTRDDDEHGWRP